MAEALAIKPEDIIKIVLKRRWYIFIPFIIAMIAGIYLSLTLPRVFSASTLILIQPQKVPSDFVRSLVSADIDSRISTISQQILSRTNLERIIREFKIFSGPEQQDMFMEDKIGALRRRIKVDVTRVRREVDSFSISFKGSEPEKVMRVANTLASYFIDENLKVREAQAIGTSDFLEDELEAMRKRLEQVEEALRNYRKKFMGELPEQLETNLRVLDRIQEQLSSRMNSLRDAKNSLAVFESSTATESVRTSEGIILPETVSYANLNQLKNQLTNLKASYTDRHPDVVKLKNKIKDLEAELKEKAGQKKTDTESADDSEVVMNRENMLQIIEVKREIKIVEDDIVKLKTQLKYYQERVEATPKREQELMVLQRDYNNIQESYSSLLNRKLEAEIAVNMEKKQKGEQFRIIDPARLPQKPVSPDMKKLLLLSIAAGLGIGGGIIFLLEYLDTSIKRPEDVGALCGLSVIAAMPSIYTTRQKVFKKINFVASIIFGIISLALFAVFAVLTIKGVEPVYEFVAKYV